jgi:RimJ/RimL family protein N-acetyltransferase
MGDLDFWIGDWDCAWEGGHGTNRVTRVAERGAVVERFEAVAPEPFVGMSVSTPDAESGRWRQTWVDTDGNAWWFTGGSEPDGTFAFATTRPVDAERAWKRMVFSDVTDDAFTWRWEASADGEIWSERWRIAYRRRGAGEAASPSSRVVIETPRLRLRELTPADEDALAAMFADPEVMTWIGQGGVVDREGARRVIAREGDNYAERGYGEWALTTHDDDEMIGLCGLIEWPDIDGAAETEVAYLLRRDVWGRGYATEAAVAIRDWAIRELGRQRLICLVYHDNVASASVARKLGMTWEKDVLLGDQVVQRFALDRSAP